MKNGGNMQKKLLLGLLVILMALPMVYAASTDKDKWDQLYSDMDSKYKNYASEDAYKMKDDMLKAAKKAYGEKSNEYARSQNLCGLIAVRLEKYDEGEKYFKNSIKLFKDINQKNNAGIVSGNLGDLYFRKDDYTNAKTYLNESVTILEELNDEWGDNDADLILPFYDLSEIAASESNYKTAIGYLKKVISYELGVYGEDETYASDLHALGWDYIYTAEYDSALYYFNKSLAVYETSENDDAMGILLNDYGVLYDYKDDYKKAIEYYHKAVEIFKKTSNKGELGNTLNNIGLAHYKLDEFYSAEEYFKQAYDLLKEVYGEDNDLTKQAKEYIGYSKQNQ